MILKNKDLKTDGVFNYILKNLMVIVRDKEMTEDEYRYVSSYLGDKNFLVFGLGTESILWKYANVAGKTIFLEWDDNKIIKDRQDIVKVEYTCHISQADDLLEKYKNGDTTGLVIDLPEEIKTTKWDCIFINSPPGWGSKCPGRMQSIYMASILSNENTDVFVHCCDRRVEDIYTKAMFSKKITQLSTLRHVKK